MMALLACAGACTADARQRVFIAGDSTASHYEKKHAPQAGWGQALGFFLAENVVVDNRASSGRSTKSFVAEGRWKDIVGDIKPDDVVLIAFGHNDARDDSPRRYTEPDGAFRENLIRFARDVRAKGGHAVILSPAARRLWEGSVMVETHGLYAANAAIAARETEAHFIDLANRSLAYFEALGQAQTKRDFLWLPPDAGRARFPEGAEDNTHFSALGACGVAREVARGLATLPALASLVAPLDTATSPGQRPAGVVACAASLPRD